MTRKDYVQFASLLNSIHHGFPALDIDAKRFLVNNMSDIFETDNPNFNRMKFKEAVYAERK
jgi:KaiC/GvpD/RAD55 family RecA-like ATPase